MNDCSVYHTMTVSKQDYQRYGQRAQQQPAPCRAVTWCMTTSYWINSPAM